jgi:DNA mismatch repair protein MutL
VVLALEAPFAEVDVNVHPTKLEVRLNNPRRVFDVIHRGVRGALSGISESSLGVSYAGVSKPPEIVPAPVALGAVEASPSASRPVDSTGIGSYQTQIKDAYSSYMKGYASQVELNPQLSLQIEKKMKENTPDARQEPIQNDAIQSDAGLFWQFNNSFIFIQVRGGIVVIDQHAAHERIIYDTSKKQFESEIPVSQQILFPIHLELSLSELDVFRSSKETFEKLGFHLEPFGGKSVLVRGYPQGLRNWDEGNLLRQLFDDVLQDRSPGETHTDRIIASFACRSAVKAGQKLSVQEMKMLADQLFAVPNPYSCPHGRPTIQRISLEEIEGWFLRR